MVSRAILTGRPWRDLSLTELAPRNALTVLEDLDPHDEIEAGLAMGWQHDLVGSILADMLLSRRAGGVIQIAWSHLGAGGAAPFAILGVAPALAPGVGVAALLARPHHRWRGALRSLAFALRADLPTWAAAHGFHRLEARSWTGHPSAARLLSAIGFAREARMPGFAAGVADFDLYALTTRPQPGA